MQLLKIIVLSILTQNCKKINQSIDGACFKQHNPIQKLSKHTGSVGIIQERSCKMKTVVKYQF